MDRGFLSGQLRALAIGHLVSPDYRKYLPLQDLRRRRVSIAVVTNTSM